MGILKAAAVFLNRRTVEEISGLEPLPRCGDRRSKILSIITIDGYEVAAIREMWGITRGSYLVKGGDRSVQFVHGKGTQLDDPLHDGDLVGPVLGKDPGILPEICEASSAERRSRIDVVDKAILPAGGHTERSHKAELSLATGRQASKFNQVSRLKINEKINPFPR